MSVGGILLLELYSVRSTVPEAGLNIPRLAQFLQRDRAGSCWIADDIQVVQVEMSVLRRRRKSLYAYHGYVHTREMSGAPSKFGPSRRLARSPLVGQQMAIGCARSTTVLGGGVLSPY
ncbi:hypothetical protein AB1N83_011885 [Pleurotus pulmonarius]